MFYNSIIFINREYFESVPYFALKKIYFQRALALFDQTGYNNLLFYNRLTIIVDDFSV